MIDFDCSNPHLVEKIMTVTVRMRASVIVRVIVIVTGIERASVRVRIL
jgi:hypothetical protein